MKLLHKLTLLLLVTLLSACSWVTLSPAGEQVRLATQEEVIQCKRVGKTTVSTLSKLAGLNRYQKSIEDELDKLARNSAADLDGDTIVPISAIEDGRQVFAVYRCKP